MTESRTEMKDRLCVALDVCSASEALALTEQLKGTVGLFKVGLELFANEDLPLSARSHSWE